MFINVPHMSTELTPLAAIDYLFACYQASDKAQSNVHTVRSFSADVAEFNASPEQTAERVQESLTALYNAYYEEVSITVNVRTLEDGDRELVISGNMMYDGVLMGLDKALTGANKLFNTVNN